MFDPDLFRLDGHVAIITGAGAGIGRGIARVFAGAGAAVVVSDLKLETAEAVAAEIAAAGGKAVGLACDVTKEADQRAVVQTALDRFGRLSILVNNAGGGGPKPFDMPMDDFRWAYELNVFSLFWLTQLAAPHMAAAGEGAVLNISSMAAENRNRRMASYASSKAAVNHLTRNIAFDLGAMGIRVNAIAPGAIKTDALASVLTPDIEKAPGRWNAVRRGTLSAALDAAGPMRAALIHGLVTQGVTLRALLADDAALEAFVRANVGGTWHASGTCRMGAAGDPSAVTAPDGTLHGMAGLSVADASVMPSIPCANTNLPTLMIAERIAAITKAALRRAEGAKDIPCHIA